jgi:hypothetical protein
MIQIKSSGKNLPLLFPINNLIYSKIFTNEYIILAQQTVNGKDDDIYIPASPCELLFTLLPPFTFEILRAELVPPKICRKHLRPLKLKSFCAIQEISR